MEITHFISIIALVSFILTIIDIKASKEWILNNEMALNVVRALIILSITIGFVLYLIFTPKEVLWKL